MNGSTAPGELFRRELRAALESTVEVVLQHGAETREMVLQQGTETRDSLVQVMARLDEIQATLNAIANGSIQLGIQGTAFFGGSPIVPAANQPARHVSIHLPSQAAALSPAINSARPHAHASRSRANNLLASNSPAVANSSNNANHINSVEPGPPTRSRTARSSGIPALGQPGGPPDYKLVRLRTVGDAWAEWKIGYNGGPAVEELERKWGGAWRPTGKARVAFCRRKVVWDEVARLIRSGMSTEDAVADLEQLRNGGSLVDLGKTIRQRQKEIAATML